MVLVAAACGQKAGVGDPETSAAPIAGATATTAASGAPSEVQAATETTAASVAGSSPTTRSGPAATGGRSSAAAPSQPTAAAPAGATSSAAAGSRPAAAGPARPTSPTTAAAAGAADPRDRDGVTDKEIVIGMHAPITGAAPVPQDSVDKAKDLYCRFLAERGGIFGRNVRIVFRDDQFNPSRARGRLPGDGRAGARLHSRRHRHRPDHLLRPLRQPGRRALLPDGWR